MGLKDKLMGFIAPVDDEDMEEELEFTEEEARTISQYEQPKAKGVTKVSSDTKMVLFEPRSFEEAEEVGRHLKERRAAVVNLHRLQREYAQRTIDFLTGVVFALDGTIQKIGHNVILCTPRTIGVHGEISLDQDEN
ncbi:cell division protein SepF [Anaerorhabdus sp.]|jgi:cell division inhibitor SepF|uniref:cell division protein SepF n=1 Tax=Anaerorhabdus sp. TaxID=1872524 RepID=UPI002FC7DB98